MGAAASHADASLLAFSISVSQGFDGTENHESLGVFAGGSACFASGRLATPASGEDAGSFCFTCFTSSTAVAVSLVLFSFETGEVAPAHASLPHAPARTLPVT